MTLSLKPFSSVTTVVARGGRVFFGWWYYAHSEGAIAVA